MMTFLIILFVVIGCIVKSILKEDDNNGNDTITSCKAYNDISDFFYIDIHNIFQYKPKYSHTETAKFGNEVKHYILRLNRLELGLFFEIEILEVAENELNFIFKGRSNSITPDLERFIKFYVDKNGLDNSGMGEIEQNEILNLPRHFFSRFWNNLMIDNNPYNDIHGNIEMSVLGLKQNSNSINITNS